MSKNKQTSNIAAKIKHPRRFSLRHIVLFCFVTMLGLQTLVIIILQILTQRQRQHKHDKVFPHPQLMPVNIGENTLQIYDFGSDLYKAMLAAIDNAQESIFLESYIWKGDEIGQTFKDHLKRKADAGVAVYVIYDSFGNLVVPQEFKNFPPNIHVLAYQAFTRPWHLLDPRHYALDHRKLLIVDGHTGFIGGFNIGSEYATKWRDTHLRVEGPAVADLAQTYIEFWNQYHKKQDQITFHYPRIFDPLINLHGTSPLHMTFPIRDMYITAIDRAEHIIHLTNAYFVPDRVLLEALMDAARRGVDVRIIVPWISNHRIVDWITHGYFTSCLEAGIRVYGYNNMLHAKTCTIDSQWSTIGTANLDRLSSVGNYEINVEIYSKAVARQMEDLFNCDTTNAFELTMDKWAKRPWYVMLSETILLPLRFLI
ncbi:MAG TPA: phospholipase D-like domain-containing protein [Ktedonobacteraceae bacterium]|nr:phospholipase D-like domain-containing protein [Ktedonobacteraceae bacterium]